MNNIYIFFALAVTCFPIISYCQVIQLNNGDSLNVIIKNKTKNTLIIEHPSLGILIINKSSIANLDSIDLHAIENAENNKSVEPKPVDEGFFDTGLLVDWDRSVDVGFHGASGSTNNTSFRLGLSTHFEDDEDRWDFKSFYIYKHNDHKTTSNVLVADLLKDWYLYDSPWFYFAHAGFDWDKFKDWDYRGRLAAGSGYQFSKNKHLELATRVGVSVVYEVREPDNNLDLEGLLGLHLLWNISEKQTLTLDNFLHPSITDAGEYRNVTTFEWAHTLGYVKGLAIKLGFYNEYNSSETEKNDLKYHAAIAWGL
jgi:putative salt-induced outer membrane protein YdiY